jgi:hypothetical protein
LLGDPNGRYWVPQTKLQGRPLPLLPLPAGMLANGVIYAMILFGAWRLVRRFRGNETGSLSPGAGVGRSPWYRRNALAVAYALFVGACIDVGVAWAMALWSPAGDLGIGYYADGLPLTLAGDAMASSEKRSGLGEVLGHRMGSREDGLGVVIYCASAMASNASLRPSWKDFDVLRSGWPLESLDCRVEWGGSPNSSSMGSANLMEIHGGARAPEWMRPRSLEKGLVGYSASSPRPLPLRPRPLGFAAGSFFYGAILIGLLELFRGARAMVRQRRGRCFNCGYQLTGEPVCPECGTNVLVHRADA